MIEIDFSFNAFNETYYGRYEDFEFVIQKQDMGQKMLETVSEIVTKYPVKLETIADYIRDQSFIQQQYDGVTSEEVAEKLGYPIIYLYHWEENITGRLTYANHSLDETYLLQVEFIGALKELTGVGLE